MKGNKSDRAKAESLTLFEASFIVGIVASLWGLQPDGS